MSKPASHAETEIGGQHFCLWADGSCYLPEDQLLVLSDLHLEKALAQSVGAPLASAGQCRLVGRDAGSPATPAGARLYPAGRFLSPLRAGRAHGRPVAGPVAGVCQPG